MVQPRRLRQLEKVILHTLGPLISNRLADPRLHLVTVTRVRLSADLSVAHVHWSCLGTPGERSKAAHALEHACGRIQGEVGRGLATRTTPRITFHYDEGIERAVRINRILEGLARERA